MLSLVVNFSAYPLLDPDEGRNAEVAREMYVTGDYVLPQLNGLPYLDKPVGYFAVGALSMRILGPTVTAARLPSLLFSIATIVVVAWFGRLLFDASATWVAAVATAATPFTVAYARTVIFDSTLTFFVVVALSAFYLAVERTARRGGTSEGRKVGSAADGVPWWPAVGWAAVAFGVLIKGPIALALPLMVVVPYAIWRRAVRALADTVGLLLFASILLPWLLAVSREIPDFIHYALVTETAKRLTTDQLHRTGPLWYFVAILPVAALPWTLVAAGSWRRISRYRNQRGMLDTRIVFLLLWIIVPLLFFSLSESKRPQYVLPLVPAIALLVAAAWHGQRDHFSGARAAAVGTALFGIFLIAASTALADLFQVSNAVAETIPRTAVALGAVCLVGGAGTWFCVRHREALLLFLTIPVATIPIASSDLMDAIGNERSAANMAGVIEQVAGIDARIVGVRAFPHSLPFYLQRTITLSSDDGSELTSNYLVQHFDGWADRSPTIRPADWWRDALINCTRSTVFVINSEDAAPRRTLEASLNLLIDTGRYAAYGPCGTTSLAQARP
jgi:4-amino-4-deoxy-L-arabinose transferase-like glycosyltransferase